MRNGNPFPNKAFLQPYLIELEFLMRLMYWMEGDLLRICFLVPPHPTPCQQGTQGMYFFPSLGLFDVHFSNGEFIRHAWIKLLAMLA